MANYVLIEKKHKDDPNAGIKDGTFKVVVGTPRVLNLLVPADLDSTQPAILAFIAVGSGGADLKYNIQIADQDLLNWDFSCAEPKGLGIGFWKTFKGAILAGGGNLPVKFTVVGGTGNLTFHNVVLWYKTKK